MEKVSNLHQCTFKQEALPLGRQCVKVKLGFKYIYLLNKLKTASHSV